ncbi:MAG: hypothetical protein LBL46_03915, partial [Rickettsiales bacterium]|nr:hypothetical protein [Rickettsiales bacterium]
MAKNGTACYKHHPGAFGASACPKEGNTRGKASRQKQNREKKMKKRIRELENKRMDFEIKGKRVR